MNIYRAISVLLFGIATFAAINYFQNNNQVEERVKSAEVSLNESISDRNIEDVVTDEEKVVSTEVVFKKDLSGQGLTSVPRGLFSEAEIEYLDLANNKLTGSLPAEVRLLQNLKVLDLSQNDFTGVPAEIGQLAKLEVLNLSGNPISGLPAELGNLKNLKLLDLSNTNYSKQDLEGIKKGLPEGVVIKVI
jgi:Leucine-rich repeat (LRR) protein